MFQLSEAEAPARRLPPPPPPPPAPPARDGTRGPQGAEDEHAGRWGGGPCRPPGRPRGGNADCTRVTWGRRREDTRAGGHTDSIRRHLEGGARGPAGPEAESSSACPHALAPDHRALVRTRQPGRPGMLPPHTACAETHPCPPPGPARARSRPSLNGHEPPSAGSRPAPQVKQLPTQLRRAALLPHGSASRQNLSRGRRTFSSALGRDRRHTGLIPAVPSLLVWSLDRLKSRCLGAVRATRYQNSRGRPKNRHRVPTGRAAGKKPYRRGASPVRSP